MTCQFPNPWIKLQTIEIEAEIKVEINEIKKI